MSENQPRILIIAGPNGAGKTTFAREYLPHEGDCPDFINADLIAAGLSPFAPNRAALQAGRLMLAEIQRRVDSCESFAFETTLSGRSYARQIPVWRQLGYRVEIIFLRLSAVKFIHSGIGDRASQNSSLTGRTWNSRRRYSATLSARVGEFSTDLFPSGQSLDFVR